MKTQTQRVYDYILDRGKITSMDAFRDLNITRLSARIFDLREERVPIHTRRITKKRNGQSVSYDEYYFPDWFREYAKDHKDEDVEDVMLGAIRASLLRGESLPEPVILKA